MKTEKKVIDLKSITPAEIKEHSRRTANIIFDSADYNKPPQLIKEAKLAEMFNITQKTVATWRTSGKIPYIKFSGTIFYSLQDVNDFIKKHRVKATI